MTAPRDPSGLTALLLLADGRFPIGGHAHSAGVEAAVTDGRVHDITSLEDFLLGRLHTAGLVDAALAAATVVRLRPPVPEARGRRAGDHPTPPDHQSADTATASGGGTTATLDELDREAAARIVAPPLRAASRRLGRQLLRVAGRCWPHPLVDQAVSQRPDGLHNAVALGVVAVAADLSAHDAASLSIHHAVTTPAQAAVRLLGLDPFAVAASTARVDAEATAVVDRAVALAHATATSPAELPSLAAPLVEIAAMEHHRADLRLFAT